MVPLTDLSGLPTERRAALERELAPLTLLQDVVEVVVQDEFTHDIVVPWEDGRYLVFDTT
jgi:hypothetical protein